ncbi:hypothetical protein [Desulfitobacterium sp.]|uniref:hypothetical protein n=1 Tax=Desulfitobacterium sp. TaxID=49981 RepID=UPI002B211108|nr:hypothetical protein [Desulfitobacterium sp.]MEA4900742.1 hypothetical protein [Desulfitobacterium sp.]
MNKVNLQKLEDQAVNLALRNTWGEDAYAVNTAILEIDHNDCAAYTRLAKYYKVNDNLTEAVNMYLRALDIDPQNRVATNNLIKIKKEKEESEAVEKINTTKELLKEAQKSMRKRKYRLASKLYSKAFSIEPTLKHATDLSGAYKEMGKYDNIEKLYRRLIKDNPIQTDQKVIEKEFKSLRRNEKERIK